MTVLATMSRFALHTVVLLLLAFGANLRAEAREIITYAADIFFERSSAAMDSAEFKSLVVAVSNAKHVWGGRPVCAYMVGHVSREEVAEADANHLSKARAEAVAAWIRAQGANFVTHFDWKGFTQAAFPSLDQRNGRVEVEFVAGNPGTPPRQTPELVPPWRRPRLS